MNPEAGWYADPNDATGLRYWDGTVWTEHTHRPDAAPATEPVTAPVAEPAVASPVDASAASYAPAEATPSYASTNYGGTNFGQYNATTQPGMVGMSEQKKGLGTGAIIGIIAGSLVLLLGIAAVAVVFMRSSSPSAPEATGDPVVPAGWETTTSPSGAIDFAYPADMTDGASLGDIDQLEEQLSSSMATEVPGATAEISGLWIDTGTTETAGSMLIVMTMQGDLGGLDLGTELGGFAQSASAGGTDLAVEDPVDFSTAVGYDAAALDFSASQADMSMYSSVSAIEGPDTLVFVYNMSPVDAASASTINRQVADSVVINDVP